MSQRVRRDFLLYTGHRGGIANDIEYHNTRQWTPTAVEEQNIGTFFLDGALISLFEIFLYKISCYWRKRYQTLLVTFAVDKDITFLE